MKTHQILLVDDDDNILRALKRELGEEGYSVYTANGAVQGQKILANETIHLIISDQKMPGMSGVEFLESTVAEYPDAIRIILTGHAELEDAVRAMNSGCVYKFILKPWHTDELKITIRSALGQFDLLMSNRNLTVELKKRDNILDQLERENPGITKRPKDGIFEIKSE